MSLTFAPDTIEFFPQAGIGKVEEKITLHQQGWVRFMATYWSARFYQPTGMAEALPGTSVKVIGIEGLTLLVIPISNEVNQPQAPISKRPEANRSGGLPLVKQIGSLFATWLS